MNTLQGFFARRVAHPTISKPSELAAFNAKAAFDALMEGAALMLDMGLEPIEFTYVTANGNKVHLLIDSPES